MRARGVLEARHCPATLRRYQPAGWCCRNTAPKKWPCFFSEALVAGYGGPPQPGEPAAVALVVLRKRPAVRTARQDWQPGCRLWAQRQSCRFFARAVPGCLAHESTGTYGGFLPLYRRVLQVTASRLAVGCGPLPVSGEADEFDRFCHGRDQWALLPEALLPAVESHRPGGGRPGCVQQGQPVTAGTENTIQHPVLVWPVKGQGSQCQLAGLGEMPVQAVVQQCRQQLRPCGWWGAGSCILPPCERGGGCC